MTVTETPPAAAPRAAPAAGLFGGCQDRDRPVEALRNAAGQEILSADQRSGFAKLFRDEGGTLHPA
jgi:hypothetical protein